MEKLQTDTYFLFLDGIEPFFWPPVLHDSLYKTLFLDFLFRPPNARNLHKMAYKIDQRFLHQTGGFQGCPIQWNQAKCCGAEPCCHGNEIWARRGHPVAYQLVKTVCLC